MFKKRLGLVLLTALAFYLIGVNLQAGWLYFLSFSLLTLIMVDFFFALSGKGGLEFARETPSFARSDEKIIFKLKIKNKGRAKRLLIIEDEFLSGSTKTIFFLSPNEEKELKIETTARRGVYEGARVTYHSAFPFHFFEFKESLFVPSELKVYPSFPYLTNFPLLEGGSFPKEVIHDWRKGSGTEFFGLREYRPGDSFRSIYWKKTASVGKPVIKEFERLVSTKTLLIIDNTKSAYPQGLIGKDAFEETIKAVAAIAEYSLHSGHPVEIIQAEESGLKYEKDLAWEEILDILARIELTGNGFENLPSFLSPEDAHQKTVVFFITPNSRLDLKYLALFQKERSRVFIFSQETQFKKEDKLWKEKLARLETKNFFICRHQKGEVKKCLQEHWRPTGVSAAQLR